MSIRLTTAKKSRVEIRKNGEAQTITGYAAVFYNPADAGTEYRIWSDYAERIMPGAFDRAIKEQHDARALFDHDSQSLLGRVSSGTCVLSVDSVGLRFEIPVDESDPDHQRVLAKIRRGDLTGCSFQFANTSANWEEIGQGEGKGILTVRNIMDCDLYDVGPVTWPAYEATEVSLRTCVRSSDDLIEARSALTAHRSQVDNLRLGNQIDMDFEFAKRGEP